MAGEEARTMTRYWKAKLARWWRYRCATPQERAFMLVCESALLVAMVSLEEAGIKEGLPRDQAEKFALHTVTGSAAMLGHKDYAQLSPAELREQVTSPGGTTEAGLAELTKDGALEKVISDTMKAAMELLGKKRKT